MALAGYREGELAFLLSLSALDVELDDGELRSCLGHVTADGDFAPSAHGEIPIPLYVRWCEVKRARARVEADRDRIIKAAEASLALDMRLQGYREREIAEALAISTPTAHRRWHALLDTIADELGGTIADEQASSTIPACLRCGEAPRARIPARTWRSASGRRMETAERQSSLCEPCLENARLKRLAQDVRRADLRAEPELSDEVEPPPDDATDHDPAWKLLSAAA